MMVMVCGLQEALLMTWTKKCATELVDEVDRLEEKVYMHMHR